MIVTCGDTAGGSETGEGIFDQMPGALGVLDVERWNKAVAAAPAIGAKTGGNQTFPPPIGTAAAVADDFGGAGRNQGRGLGDVVALTAVTTKRTGNPRRR